MNFKSLFHKGLLIVMMMPLSSYAELSADEKLNVFVETVVTFKADFEQNVLDAKGNKIETATGQFVLERPGKFRWDYSKPYQQHIIADGDNIWFYDVDLEQVTVKSQREALTSTPAALLSGDISPSQKYYVTNLESDDGLSWVKLVPKDNESNFQLVTLAFEGNILKQMIMRDSFDQVTQLIFSDNNENITLSNGTFDFTPPQGVDVVGDVVQ